MHINFSPDLPKQENVTFEEFLKLEIRIGTVINVEDFPESRNPSYKIWIDFGKGIGTKKTSAQLTWHYSKEKLTGKRVAAVVNFPPRQIGTFMSEVLVLGFSDADEKVVLFDLDYDVPNGARLH